MHGIATKASFLFKRTSFWVLLVITPVLLFSCKDDLLLKEALDNIGHQAKLSMYYGKYELDISDESSEVNLFLRYSDRENGALLEKIEFVSSFQSFDGDFEFDERHLLTIDASELSPDSQTDSLSINLAIPMDSLTSPFGLSHNDLDVGDRFDLRWKVYLTEGDTLELECPKYPLADVICRKPRIRAVYYLSDNQFTGTYRFEQQERGPLGWWLFSESFEAQLTVNRDNHLSGRLFKAEPYAEDLGTLDSITVKLDFDRIATPASNYIGTGYNCNSQEVTVGGTGAYGREALNNEDDSHFTLFIAENTKVACGAPYQEIILTATKIEE